MKLYAAAALIALFTLTGCLKESIHEAMLNTKNGPKVKATFSYKVNGEPVNVEVADARDQSPSSYQLICMKESDHYYLYARTNSGYTTLYFKTDTLATGNYRNTTATVGEIEVLDHVSNNQYFAQFIHAPGDYTDVNITSHANGFVSGNFTCVLTPLLDGGGSIYIFGPSGSTVVTAGTFTNIPVFY